MKKKLTKNGSYVWCFLFTDIANCHRVKQVPRKQNYRKIKTHISDVILKLIEERCQEKPNTRLVKE